ncbi:unnamed protein product (mitochondrion) [Plasmodiophora brassicae]|uniref:F-box/LRR-repeat protein 15-like leucin rich repeat domain-containing protein n=1 Tax=Plasmodiophora brassicae TaxID=37360 RepID=A0A0G4J0Y7_PLABS|nr:hypothetical protein PBRA_008331 [Plasmodiophora brassicae]SPQ95271.1 unnamed protein product [Plasmodiophora brassicae]
MLANFITSAGIPVCRLDLSFTQVNDAELYLLARACSTSLQTLSLAGCHRVGPEGVQAFGRYCPTLTFVDFQCLDGLSDVALQDIVHRLQDLQSIDIGACQNLTNISFQIIASHGRALKRVSAAGCQQVTECDLDDLSKCTSMTSLSLRACRRLTDDSVRHLARLGRRKAHRGLPPLKWLDLGGCTRLTHRSILAIARENRDLEHLDLRGIALGEDTQLELTRLLPRCTYLNMGTPARGHLNKY